MMIKLFLAVLFCSVVVMAATNCSPTCQTKAGDPCGSANYTCGYGLWCNVSACAEWIPVGSTCSATNYGSCAPPSTCGYNFATMSYSCKNATVGPGHKCSSDAECSYGTGAGNCTNGYCFGLAVGAACTQAQAGTTYANVGGYCNGSVVVQQFGWTDDCDADTTSTYGKYYQCQSPLACLDGNCELFWESDGERCQSVVDCEEGLYCKANATLGQPGTCLEPLDPSGNSCTATDSSACNADEYCACGLCGCNCTQPVTYPDGFRDAYITYALCIANETIACQQAIPVGCDACYDAWCTLLLLELDGHSDSETCLYSQDQLALIARCISSATTASATVASTTGSSTGQTATSGAVTAASTTQSSTSATTAATTTGASSGQSSTTSSTTAATATTNKATTTTTGGAATTSSASVVGASFVAVAALAVLF